MSWEIHSSEIVYEAGIMKMRKNRSVNPRNGAAGDYFILHFPDWVTVLPFTKTGELVMIRQYRHGSDTYELEIPGGCVEPGEDPLKAGVRELEEETAYVGGVPRLVGKVRPNTSTQDNWCYTLVIEGVELQGECNLDEGEDIEVVLMSPGKVKEAIVAGELSNAMMISSLYLAGI